MLLDTLIAARAKHDLKINSDDTRFDVTTIYSDPATKKYSMRTYIQVNPDNWHIDDRIDLRTEGVPVPTYISYSNAISISSLPSSPQMVQFGAKQVYLSSYSYQGASLDTLRVKYDRKFATDLSYLLLPEQGKYIFAEVTSTKNHVDFSNAGTAVKRKYNKPEGVLSLTSSLMGYTKAGDYNEPIQLYLSGSNFKDYDLQYPPTGIEEFELLLFYEDREGYRHHHTHIGPSVPEEMPLLSKSDFTVTKAKFSDFQVQYGEDKPSTLKLVWQSWTSNLNAEWQVFLSPEETAFNLQGFVEKLSPHSLEGKDLSGVNLYRVLSQTAKGYTHQSMHDYLNKPEAYLKKELKQYKRILRFLR